MAELKKGACPHVRAAEDSRSIMLDMTVAMMPAVIWGIYAFGLRAAVILLESILFCALLDWLMAKVLRLNAAWDLSAIGTGLVLAAVMPVSVPLWLPPLGAIFAIAIFKHLPGHFGVRAFNPALYAVVALFLIFPGHMTRFIEPFSSLPAFAPTLSAEVLKEATTDPAIVSALRGGTLPPSVGFSQLLTGTTYGGIFTVPVILLLAGGLYLLVRRVITWHVPVSVLTTAAVVLAFFAEGGWEARLRFALLGLFYGPFVFAAVFLATEPNTCPVTRWGKVFGGVVLALLVLLFRFRTDVVSWVYVPVLLCGLLSRPLDYFFRPRVYGDRRHPIRSFKALPAILSASWNGFVAELIPKKEKTAEQEKAEEAKTEETKTEETKTEETKAKPEEKEEN